MKLVSALKQRLRGVAFSSPLLSPRFVQCAMQSVAATAMHRVPHCEENVAIREPYVILKHWIAAAQKYAPQCKPRVACVATVDAAGQPVTRLTNVEQINAAGITFYTALGSRQAGEVNSNPHVSMQFHWPQLHRSIQITGIASPVCDLQAQRQFASYPREVQLYMHGKRCMRRSTRNWLVVGRLYDKLVELLIRMCGKHIQEIPKPHNWGGFLLKPNLYEFFEASHELPGRQCMRFRRCLTLPRGRRNQMFNADPSDWVFDSCIDHAG